MFDQCAGQNRDMVIGLGWRESIVYISVMILNDNIVILHYHMLIQPHSTTGFQVGGEPDVKIAAYTATGYLVVRKSNNVNE